MKFNYSLKQYWTYIVVFSVIIPVIILSVWFGLNRFNNNLNHALTLERISNKLLNIEIESEVARLKTILINKSDAFSFFIDKKNNDKEFFKIYELLKIIIDREPSIHEIIILSKQGEVIAAVDPEMGLFGDRLLSSHELTLVAQRAGYHNIKESPEFIIPIAGRIYIGPPQPHDFSSTFSIAFPIGSPVSAVLVALIDVRNLWWVNARIKQFELHNTNQYFVDQYGKLITKIKGQEFEVGDLMTHVEIIHNALFEQNWDSKDTYVGVLGKTVYGTYTNLSSLNWTLVSEVNAMSITQPIINDLFKIILIIFVAMLGFIWLALYLSKYILNPLEQVSNAITKVTEGYYNFSLKLTGIKEIDEISAGINNLITVRNKNEIELTNKESEQAEILESMVNAVISINEKGMILSYNSAAGKLFGYSADEVLGLNIKILMPQPFYENHDGYLEKYIAGGESHIIGVGRTLEGKKKNNEIFPMRLYISELQKDFQGNRRFIGSCIDLTHIQQQEELLRHSYKMDALGKLTGGIAHDYNNMLGVVLGYAGLLKDNLVGDVRLSKYIEQVINAAQRGAKLTRKLLDFASHGKVESSNVNINHLLKNQYDLLSKTLTVRIKLEMNLADDIWLVELDSNDLEDAILNISINAMHAMGTEQSNLKFTISTSNYSLDKLDAEMLGLETGDYVVLRLTDTGTGMDKMTREKIFDPFFSTKGDKGTGLGLSQVFGFITRAGGVIKVYSQLGTGTQFVLYFPRLADVPDEDEDEVDGNPIDVDYSGKEKILIVDDEEALRDLAAVILKGAGYRVLHTGSAREALSILEKEKIDLLFTDIIMPDMDGYQLAAVAQGKYSSLKILFVSGFTGDSDLELVDKKIRFNILDKPYKAKTLLKCIRELLD